jgi:hypothetical protein
LVPAPGLSALTAGGVRSMLVKPVMNGSVIGLPTRSVTFLTTTV